MAQATTAQTKRQYETIFILNASADRATAEGVSERLKEVIGREKGVLTKVENWGRRRLAYPLGRQTRGVYVYFEYQGGGGLVAEVERNLRLADSVLKFQTVKTAEIAETREVAAEDVKFEHIEIDPNADPEETLEQRLGLSPRSTLRDDSRDDGYDYGSDGFDDDAGGEES
jgi:small subunit ribosomal protein S6